MGARRIWHRDALIVADDTLHILDLKYGRAFWWKPNAIPR
jgi:hypothetical protein